LKLEAILWSVVESGALFTAIWLAFRAFPWINADGKAWIWRGAFLKPLLLLLPFSVIVLHVLPASEPIHTDRLPSPTRLGPDSHLAPVQSPDNSAPDPLAYAWAVGTLAMIAFGVRNRIQAGKLIQNAVPIDDVELLYAYEDLAKRARIKRRVRFLRSKEATSAMLVGGIHPTIVLPESVVESNDLVDARLMLAHEMAHLARRDLFWLGALWIVQALFFFNPFVWLAAHCARQEHESATDRLAAELASASVTTYAEMLLRAVAVARPSLAPGYLPMAESARSIRQRLLAMKHFQSKPSPWRRLGVAMLALLIVGVLPSYQLAKASPPQGDVETNWTQMSHNLISLKFTNFDARHAIVKLFLRAKKQYVIEPKVHGTLTVELHNVTFDVALQNMLRQVDASYRIEKGTYVIVAKPMPKLTIPFIPAKESKSTPTGLITFKMDNADVRQVLREIFKSAKVSYSIAPEVQGALDVDLKDASFDVALKMVLDRVHATYRIENGVYEITHVF